MTNVVNPAELVTAAGVVDAATQHFKARCHEMHDVEFEMRSKGPLAGGYGETGSYREALWDFTEAFGKEFRLFLDDEDDFVRFLEGFRDRIEQAAGIYQQNDLAAEESMNQIAHGLDAEGA